MSDSTLTRHGRLILVPAVITLAVTLLRLVGELPELGRALVAYGLAVRIPVAIVMLMADGTFIELIGPMK